MRLRFLLTIAVVLGGLNVSTRPAPGQVLLDSIHAEGVPPIPVDLLVELGAYGFSDAVDFQGWLAGSREVLFLKHARGLPQAFRLDRPGGFPLQLTFDDRPVAWVCPDPSRRRFVSARDDGGNERFQLFLHDLDRGEVRPITNGHWRTRWPLWSPPADSSP